MAFSYRKVLVALVVIGPVALTALLVLTPSRPPARAPLPNPNGYDDFIKAGEAVVGNAGDYPTLDHERLRLLMSTNAESLRLFRVGLNRQCVMPTNGPLTQSANLKSLVQLVGAEGRLAEMENRNTDAAQSYLDAIRLGDEASRGGIIINRLVGIACEGIGCSPLSKLAPNLKCDEARSVIAALEKIDGSRVTWDEVMRNERRFVRSHRTGGNPISWTITRWQEWNLDRRAEQRHKIAIVHERLLATELALRCYRSEHGRVPAHLDELATNYLSHVPEDPFSRKPLIYRPQGTNWVAYSIGPDGVDDGGKPVGRGSAKGDIFFDSVY